MRDMMLGKPMESQHPSKHRHHKGIPPLLICWLVALGFMILISSQEHHNTQQSDHQRNTAMAPAIE